MLQESEAICLTPGNIVSSSAYTTGCLWGAKMCYLFFLSGHQQSIFPIYLPSNKKQKSDLSTCKLTNENCCSLHRTDKGLGKIRDLQMDFNNTRRKVKQEDAFLLVIFLAEKPFVVSQINPCHSFLCINTLVPLLRSANLRSKQSWGREIGEHKLLETVRNGSPSLVLLLRCILSPLLHVQNRYKGIAVYAIYIVEFVFMNNIYTQV